VIARSLEVAFLTTGVRVAPTAMSFEYIASRVIATVPVTPTLIVLTNVPSLVNATVRVAAMFLAVVTVFFVATPPLLLPYRGPSRSLRASSRCEKRGCVSPLPPAVSRCSSAMNSPAEASGEPPMPTRSVMPDGATVVPSLLM